MTRTSHSLKKVLLAGFAGTCLLPAAAFAQLGGFDTEIRNAPAKQKIKERQIVDVRIDPAWKGPRSISQAIPLVEEAGEIVVHPGVYPPESVYLSKSVSIRGIRDSYGEAPTLVANGSCVTVASDAVSARISDVAFKASRQTCVSVTNGHLEIQNSSIEGRNAGYAAPSANRVGHLAHFDENAAAYGRSALVSVQGGRVSIVNTRLVGGETGVRIATDQTGNAFEHVSLRDNIIAQMSGAGVVMVGNVDATLSSNSIINNGMGGVVYSASGHARLIGNIISNNAYNGLYIQGLREAVSVEGNQIHDNADDGIEVRSGTAILVGNDIGEHRGCRVKEAPLDRSQSQHLAKPPITLLADAQGINPYAIRNGCETGRTTERTRRRGGRRAG